MTVDALTSEDGPPLGLLDTHIESFLRYLRAAGYAERTLRRKQLIAASFAQWTRRRKVAIADLNESNVRRFVRRSPRRTKEREAFEWGALRLFLQHLRAEGDVKAPPWRTDISPGGELERRYLDYLRNERGLKERSAFAYMPYVHDFLMDRMTKPGFTSPAALDARAVRDFLLDRIGDRPTESSQLLATAIRSFLRFLHLRGETDSDLSLSIPMVRRWRQATVHAFLSPEDVERVLAATDRSNPHGRRDYAILLLLGRLGLRAGEVLTLELGDISWRTGEIIVRGKGRVLDRLPLLSDVGEALALYLREDRGASRSRRVFLRHLAPRVELGCSTAIGHIVRAAFARVGLRPSSPGAAHLFRHGLATRMIRQGASMAEISQVLRHRSQNSTAVYAKVAFEALREVARPWPGAGGAE